MVLGVGADVLLVERMRRCIDSPSFMKRAFSDAETQAGASRPDPGSYYAKVFAGKEAVFKCFGIAADSLGSWRDIEIADGDEGQPMVTLSGPLALLASCRMVERVLVSLSYDTDYALAFAALVGGVQHGD